ncbi:carbohydrate-binding protein [Amycolatopsis mediterranei S699]|uniref:Carbohydrate-binding protein n=3 Tax=Amycolatopsis mediterranei TaxID=33910 RepID=A0A0H3DJ70_AMYMU|nr:RICIN domain-containing protein [Amycolatopsis mediterranei]ADJ50193.1 carbohydrate-binding protein [Amycolatopsis mediterranei U32]AFO81901.1 carbohydrate-binding protein [Amycolatopsis mediterranei S699]AGT89030.1 carbohydrate-binding protein [Amycolatopsis mediterranei RB]KDO07558.1 carbohydrate-binding protein [Amycolatopsis mediterranei]KDU93547.1 carbohydrate-binding protein [Amycolatopsis mediterranei]
MRKTGHGHRSEGAAPRRRGRWTVLALASGLTALVGPYLYFTRDSAEPVAAAVDTVAYYQFVSVRSGNALDVAGADHADGVRIQEEKRATGAASQQWQVKLVGGGFCRLVNHNSGKVLGVRKAATGRAGVEQQSDTGAAGQQWKLTEVGNGVVKIVSRDDGLVLGVPDGADGAIVPSADGGGTDQQWKLAKTATAAPPSAPTRPGAPRPSSGAPAPPPAAPAGSGRYTWRNVPIAGGGFVTGFVFNPSRKGLLYARTDVGGAYRWDAGADRWVPLTDWAADWNTYGIESVATDPVDPDRLYLATGTYTNDWAGNGALLRSTDQGRTFQRTDLPFKLGGNEDGRSMGERLAIDPADHGTLYLGTRKNGLWRSTDYGATWNQVPGFPVTDGASSGVGLSFVTFGPAGSKTIYVGAADKTTSLYRSTDGGVSWQAVPGQPAGQLPQHGVLSGDGSLYVTYTDTPGPNGVKAGSVWKYAPAGGAWKDVSPIPATGFGFAGLAVDPQSPGTVLVTTLDRWWPSDELYRSTDGGGTWKALGATSVRDASAAPYVGTGIGHWMGALALDPFDPGHVLYGTGSGLWASNDVTAADRGGATHWTVPAKGLEETAVLGLVAPPGGKLISALGDVGGFRHDDLAEVPAAASSGPRFSNTTGIDFAQAKPDTVVRVGYSDQARGAYSTDGGVSWRPFAGAPVSGAGGGTVAISADGGTVVWTASGQVPAVSTDRGATWTASTGLPKGTAVVADRAAAGSFYALSGGTLFAGTDGGKSFTARAGGLPGGHLEAAPGRAGDLWIADRGGLLHSTDGGASFSKLGKVGGADALGFGKAAPGASYPALYLGGTVSGGTGIFRSTDGGATWVRINDDQHQYGGSTGVITGDPDVYGRVYLGSAAARGVLYGDLS